jgi:hypothetical protein
VIAPINWSDSMKPKYLIGDGDYVVDPLPVVARESGVSLATLRREIKAGRGPTLTWLSQRRCGVQRRHRREWLDQRSNTAA